MEYQTFDRFEYKIVKLISYKLEEQLNTLGKDGWELISIQNDQGIFKRKLDCVITD